MNTKHLVYTAIMAASTAAGGISTEAQASLEAGLLANYFVADNGRTQTNNGLGAALDLVYLWSDYEGVSVRGSYANLETDMPIETDFQRYTGTVGYWRYLDGDGFKLPSFRPYVNGAVGFGIQEVVTTKSDSDSGILLEAAAGVVSTWDVFVPKLKFRAELRGDYESVYSDVVDLTIGMGVHYTFGESKAAPVVVAPPPPAPVKPAKPAPAPAPAPVAADGDGDGIKDKDDSCPGTAKGVPVDGKGCAQIEKVVLKGVTFATGSATLKPEAFPTLRSVAASLNANPKIKIEIGGHSDAQGDDKKNQALSEKRAGSVKSFLIKEGIAGDRISVKGYGEAVPVDTNDTPAGRANNRRVEFKVN